MAAIKVSEGIYSVGVLNPNLRVFDIIMKTEFGTSYNAYLVKGDGKTALIETVHAKFFDEYLSNISEVCDVSTIDYVILNHCEPDHSGALARLLEVCPNIRVIASVPGIKYLSGITNRAFDGVAAKDGDSIDLGGRELRFISAPFLHWPDSMFTYSSSDRTLFSCDFLGAHYCEPGVLDKHIKYPRDYEGEFINYYQAIFSPFKKFVLAGLAKIDGLDIDRVCTSHGPVLSERLAWAKEKYRLWSTEAPMGKTAAIVYVSAYGCTRALAETARDLLEEQGYEVTLMDAIEHTGGELKEAVEASSLLLVGSPTINKDALKPIWDVISSLDAVSIKGRPCGVFGSYGWSGEGVPMLVERLRTLGLKVHQDGLRANFMPSSQEIESIKEYVRGMLP